MKSFEINRHAEMLKLKHWITFKPRVSANPAFTKQLAPMKQLLGEGKLRILDPRNIKTFFHSDNNQVIGSKSCGILRFYHHMYNLGIFDNL